MGDSYYLSDEEDNDGAVAGFLSSQAAVLKTMFGALVQKRRETDHQDEQSNKRSI
jgi:hypothetical protein